MWTPTVLELSFGVSGSHSWKHTKSAWITVAAVAHYVQQSILRLGIAMFLLGITQQITRHISLNLRENAGIFTQAFGLGGLSQTVPFDPSQSYIPTTTFFNNRTYYLSTQVDLKIQKTARLSFDFGGANFLNRYRAAGLIGSTGLGARGMSNTGSTAGAP